MVMRKKVGQTANDVVLCDYNSDIIEGVSNPFDVDTSGSVDAVI